MPSFFFKRRRTPAKDSSKPNEDARATHNAPYSQKRVSRRIYAQSSRQTARYDLDDLSKSNIIHICTATEPDIVPLHPSRRRNAPVTNRNKGEKGEEKEGGAKAVDGSVLEIREPSYTLPFPSPTGTFGPPRIEKQTVAKLKNAKGVLESRSRASSQSDRWSDTATSAFYSQYPSSSSFVSPVYGYSASSSSNTFGVRTPARSFSSGRRVRVNEIFFNHLETPPPLPPLNHPAFLPSSHQDLSKSQTREGGVRPATTKADNEKDPRHTRSLPSIRRGSRDTTSFTKPRRAGSKSSFVTKLADGHSKATESAKKGHTRAQSKSSIASNLSRRSSAEFSAKQASLAGVDDELNTVDNWEVQVSKAVLRLSLVGDVQDGGHTSASGASVGRIKRSSGEAGEIRGLGPAFSLQDTLDQDQSNRRTAVVEAAGHSSRIPSSVDSAISITSMSESHGATTTSKGILNPSSGKLRPKVNNAPRQARSNSSTDRTRTPSPSPPKIDTASTTTGLGAASSSLLAPPSISFTSPTPEATPISPKRVHHKSTPTQPSSALRGPTPPSTIQKSHSSGSTKRKADEADVDSVTPPREHKTTFAPEPRTHRASTLSGSSHAPSSYHRSKRMRTSLPASESHTPTGKGTLTPIGGSPDAKSTGSWSSRNSKASASHAAPHRASRPPSSSARDVHASGGTPRRSASRRSLSQASIPISAFMSPHAPSVARSASTYHMRDPRKPARIQDTPWSLSFPDEVPEGGSRLSLNGWTERGGSPLHSWLFFIGFVIFPLWWIAGFAVPIPRTRRLDSGDAEKGVVLDDPQVEHDYKSWRRRCRIMAVVSILTYVPFIVLVAIYAPRS